MEFIPAGEVIGKAHQIRTVEIADSPQLPDGEYQFVDMYCKDPACDCRKTMIQVLHDGQLVSTINYGWESASFYEKWMGSGSGDDDTFQMHGASIDITSPNKVPPRAMLGLFNALLNEKWIEMFREYYTAIKQRSR